MIWLVITPIIGYAKISGSVTALIGSLVDPLVGPLVGVVTDQPTPDQPTPDQPTCEFIYAPYNE